MRSNKWIWLDMDGTFVDFYGVDGWLNDLALHNTRPYEVAKSLYSDVDLIEVLLVLKDNGYNIGIISWSSREHNEDFDNMVRMAKLNWLYNKGYDVVLDKIIVTQHGLCKADTCRPYGYGILVDDEEPNRLAWNLGETINANENIINALWKLVN